MFDKAFFNSEQKEIIKRAIQEAELNTSGEIRVHLSKTCSESVLDCASYWFEKLKMHKTIQRNCILFFLASNDKKFAVIGDVGINRKVEHDFWDHIKDNMLLDFKNDRFTEGLVNGIQIVGKQLKQHYPNKKTKSNNLPDEISES